MKQNASYCAAGKKAMLRAYCIETPILLAMLPDLRGKTVLDIGCGMGQHAKQRKNDLPDARNRS